MLVPDRLHGSHRCPSALPPDIERDGRPRTAVTFGRRQRTRKAVTPVQSERMVTVTILAGPRAGEWFVTRLSGLRDGLGFAYLDGHYVFTSDPVTGRWGAIPAPLPPPGSARQP